MKLRTLVVAIVVLAALSAIVAFVRRDPTPSAADARVGQPLVERKALEQAAKLRLSDQGKSVTLTREADGSWKVPSYFDLPADFQKLSRFVDDLSEAKLQRLVTTSPERLARLEFKDTKIEVLDPAEKPLWSATLGKNAETGGRFVRFGDENKAFLANLNAWIDADPKNWADAQLLKLKPEDIAKVEAVLPEAGSAASTPVVVSRAKKEDAWTADKTPANSRVKADKVSSLLSSLTSLRFTETLEPDDAKVVAAKSHERRFKLTTFDGKTYAIAIAQKPEEKKLKPPTADGKAALATLEKSLTNPEQNKDAAAGEDTKDANQPPKPLAPEYETVPAGPAFVAITASDEKAPINAIMQKRAFQIADYTVTSLPQTTAEFFEPAPPPAAPAPAASSAATVAPTTTPATTPAAPQAPKS